MIDLIEIGPQAGWPAPKQRMYRHLQHISEVVAEKKTDITSNLGTDWFKIRYTCAIFGEEGRKPFHLISSQAPDYSFDEAEDKFNDAVLKTKYKTLKTLLDIAQYHSIDTTFEDEGSPGESARDYLPEGANSAMFDAHGFFEKSNCYYSLEATKSGFIPKSFTNFKLRVLFHMYNGLRPRRVVELCNDKGTRLVVDIETDRLASKGEFKKFCEGLGNFRFWGSEGKLDALKGYLYTTEASCEEIKVLGWNDQGFWAWSNGVYNARYHPLDENGFVELHGKHYYIPAGNEQQPNRRMRFSNELRFKHVPNTSTNLTEWCTMYTDVFGANGMIIQMFAISCLFSDIVFHVKNFFPMLFVYGEGGSGKGTAIKMAQRIFGVPQDPLTLSGKANTDKAKIAVFAQFVNSMLLLEEYTNNPDTDHLLKNLWDRYGYKRRTMDMGYGTETVPIQSGVAITGNFTPADDPLLQRIIYLEQSKNKFSHDEGVKFSALSDYSEHGLTHITHELLRHRQAVDEQYRELHQDIKGKTARLLSSAVTSRMVENITVLLTCYKILAGCGVVFPYTYDQLLAALVDATNSQNDKRETGGDGQKFIDIFYHLVSTGVLTEDKEYKLDNDYVYIYFKQVHPLYMIAHRTMYGTAGLTYRNLLDKLKASPFWHSQSECFRIGEARSSGIILKYSKINVDLVGAAAGYKAKRRADRSMHNTPSAESSQVSQMSLQTGHALSIQNTHETKKENDEPF